MHRSNHPTNRMWVMTRRGTGPYRLCWPVDAGERCCAVGPGSAPAHSEAGGFRRGDQPRSGVYPPEHGNRGAGLLR
jgi:hypothetical protein